MATYARTSYCAYAAEWLADIARYTACRLIGTLPDLMSPKATDELKSDRMPARWCNAELQFSSSGLRQITGRQIDWQLKRLSGLPRQLLGGQLSLLPGFKPVCRIEAIALWSVSASGLPVRC